MSPAYRGIKANRDKFFADLAKWEADPRTLPETQADLDAAQRTGAGASDGQMTRKQRRRAAATATAETDAKKPRQAPRKKRKRKSR